MVMVAKRRAGSAGCSEKEGLGTAATLYTLPNGTEPDHEGD